MKDVAADDGSAKRQNDVVSTYTSCHRFVFSVHSSFDNGKTAKPPYILFCHVKYIKNRVALPKQACQSLTASCHTRRNIQVFQISQIMLRTLNSSRRILIQLHCRGIQTHAAGDTTAKLSPSSMMGQMARKEREEGNVSFSEGTANCCYWFIAIIARMQWELTLVIDQLCIRFTVRRRREAASSPLC